MTRHLLPAEDELGCSHCCTAAWATCNAQLGLPACLLVRPQTFFGAGATFGDVLRPAVLKHQRAVVSGHDLTVGPGGCLLGGCHGALARLHGLGGWGDTPDAVCTW
jgi:hypothetical protein